MPICHAGDEPCLRLSDSHFLCCQLQLQARFKKVSRFQQEWWVVNYPLLLPYVGGPLSTEMEFCFGLMDSDSFVSASDVKILGLEEIGANGVKTEAILDNGAAGTTYDLVDLATCGS